MNNTPETAAESANASAAVRTDATVRAVINHAVETAKISPEQGEVIFWLHGYGLNHGLSNAELSAKTGISKTAISQLFSGHYPADDWSQMVQRIAQFKREIDDAVRLAKVGFIETETANTIFQICDNARHDHMPGFLYGASHSGKTTALVEYVRRANNPSVKYLRCRAGMTRARLARLLGETCHIRNIDRLTSNEIIDAVADSLSSSSLLILDEFHMLTETVKSDVSRQLVEYIREIYDLTHCGMVTAATKVGLMDLTEGPNKMLFDQFYRRGILKVVLADVPPVKDINAFARAFALPPPHGDDLKFVKNLLKTRGLGVYSAYLAKARAKIDQINKKNPAEPSLLTWDFFQQLSNGFEALGCIQAEY